MSGINLAPARPQEWGGRGVGGREPGSFLTCCLQVGSRNPAHPTHVARWKGVRSGCETQIGPAVSTPGKCRALPRIAAIPSAGNSAAWGHRLFIAGEHVGKGAEPTTDCPGPTVQGKEGWEGGPGDADAEQSREALELFAPLYLPISFCVQHCP